MIRVKALIVEDNDNWQFIIHEGLESYSCDVDMASTYDEATRRLENAAYDMVTLDMALSQVEVSLGKVNASRGWLILVNQIRKVFPGPVVFVISESFMNQPQRVSDMLKKHRVQDFMDKAEFDPLLLEQWVNQVRSFKEAGGRPDLTPRGLLDNSQPGEMTHELHDLYERQSAIIRMPPTRTKLQQELRTIYEEVLAILRRNKAEAELQKAKHGTVVPVLLMNSIHDYEQEIKRIEEIVRSTLDSDADRGSKT